MSTDQCTRRPALAPLALTLALLLPAAAVAQQAPARDGTTGKAPATTDGRGNPGDARSQAPVGHRQPRADEKPASIPKDQFDSRIEQLNREANRSLRICRDC
jgi:hypothetical protein